MYRKPLVVANWKMNTNLADATVLAQALKNGLEDINDVQIIICPPMPWLYPLSEILHQKLNHVHLGCQDVYFEKEGAFTGAVSAEILKGLIEYVIVGHSEREKYFGEDDGVANKKLKAVLAADLAPILCVGEKEKIHLEGKGGVIDQLSERLDGISEKEMEKIIIAYEPVWAIGTGEAATGGYAAAVADDIRAYLAKKYSTEISEKIRVLYGGSVTAENINEFTSQPAIDGVLAGGASLKAGEFLAICKKV